MIDSNELVYHLVYKNKIILKTENIKKYNIYVSLFQELDEAGMTLTTDELQHLANKIEKIVLEDGANLDTIHLTQELFRLYLIEGIEALENMPPREVLIRIYDNEF